MTLRNDREPAGHSAREELLAELSLSTRQEREGIFRSWLRSSISLVHLHVLTILEAGPMPMSRLAEALDVSVAAATGIVDRMVERRLVERRHATEDRRMVLVQPTRRGARVFEVLIQRRRALLRPVLERMTDDEIAAMLTGVRAMRRIRAELGTASVRTPRGKR